MMIVLNFFAALAVLRCASADNVATSILLPDGLFTSQPLPLLTFVGQVTVTRSTTYYTLDCNPGGTANYFLPIEDQCNDGSYTFSETSASTQYLLEYFETFLFAAASSYSTGEFLETSTINCDPLETYGSATCTTTCPDGEHNASTNSVDEPAYSPNIESNLYRVIFTTAAGYGAASSTAAISATPSATSSVPRPTSATSSSPKPLSTTALPPPPGPSTKLGIGLGVPLGACALAGIALLLYRHGKHKERSRKSQMENLEPPSGFATGSDGKRVSEAELAGQRVERQPPAYSAEMQG